MNDDDLTAAYMSGVVDGKRAATADLSFPGGYDARKAWAARPEHERILRRLLALAYSMPSGLYGDDGELQDNRQPWIDYVRDSAADIERAITERGRLAMQEAARHCPECPEYEPSDRNEFCFRHGLFALAVADRLAEIARIIERVDDRCMADEGPITPTLQEMTQAEISRIYLLASDPRG